MIQSGVKEGGKQKDKHPFLNIFLLGFFTVLYNQIPKTSIVGIFPVLNGVSNRDQR
jgi:hypothetical protein